jgi:hypothetical protein
VLWVIGRHSDITPPLVSNFRIACHPATIPPELVMLMVFPFTSTCFLSEPQMDPIGEEIQFHLPMRSH